MASPPFRPLVALARDRLTRTTSARLGVTLAAITAVVFGAIAVLSRLSESHAATTGDVITSAAKWCAWLAAGPVALAAAHGRSVRDRIDGVDDLAASRGASARAVESARTLAAMVEIALVVVLPLLALALLSAGLSSTTRAALRPLRAVPGALGFALIVGVTLGGIASACGRMGARRGRAWLVCVILVPWIFADLAGRSAISIPGALDAVLEYTLGRGA